jgi:hypothetical protein
VDLLIAILRRSEESSRNLAPKSALLSMLARGLRLSVSIQRLHPSRRKNFVGGRKALGTGTLDMHRISPGDSLSRNHRQRRTLVRAVSEHLTLLTEVTLRLSKN